MKWLFIVFAVAALWLSTAVGYYGGDDVRAFIALMIVTACFAATYCSRGRRRCFWFAFSFFLFVAAFSQSLIGPSMYWVSSSMRPLVTEVDIFGNRQQQMPSERIVEFYSSTIKLAIDLMLATMAGFIGLSIYDYGTADE